MSPSSPGRAALIPLERGRGRQASRISITSTAFPVSPWAAAQAARPETKLRSHRNHQQRDPGASGQLERHGTPDPVRS